jgi:hypothetical protein
VCVHVPILSLSPMHSHTNSYHMHARVRVLPPSTTHTFSYPHVHLSVPHSLAHALSLLQFHILLFTHTLSLSHAQSYTLSQHNNTTNCTQSASTHKLRAHSLHLHSSPPPPPLASSSLHPTTLTSHPIRVSVVLPSSHPSLNVVGSISSSASPPISPVHSRRGSGNERPQSSTHSGERRFWK